MKNVKAIMALAALVAGLGWAQTPRPAPPSGAAAAPGGVTSVSGTANQVCVATGTTTPVLSICTDLDLSGLTSTKPIKSGTSLPATCGVGEFYDKTDATAGANLYSCTATNTWTVVGGGASPAGSAGCVQLYGTSTTLACDTTFLVDTGTHTVKVGGLFQMGPDQTTGNTGYQFTLADNTGFAGLLIQSAGSSGGFAELDTFGSRGTIAAPQNSQAGDYAWSQTHSLRIGGSVTNIFEVFSAIQALSGSDVTGQFQFLNIAPGDTGGGNTVISATGRNVLVGAHNGDDFDALAAATDSTLTIENTVDGITTHVIRQGAMQSTTDITQWQDSTKTVKARVKAGGILQPSGYNSSDGTAGFTGTCTILGLTNFVVKNGLVTGCS